jgi:hypothetical protein
MGRAGKQVPATRRRSGLTTEFARLVRSMVDSYHPEQHYMRGPGPKWLAKHAAQPVVAPEMPGLARIEG